MANGRIWISCTSCRDQRLLAKTWPGRTNLWEPDYGLEEWLQQHIEECHDNHTGEFRGFSEPFDLDFDTRAK